MMTLRSLGGLRVLQMGVLIAGLSAAAETTKPMAEGTHRVKVEALHVDGKSYSVTLKGSDSKANISTRSSTSNRADEDTLKFLSHLKQGGEYDFPKIFEDVFGKDYATMHGAVVREFGFAPGKSPFPPGFFVPPSVPNWQPATPKATNLFELGKVPKFKGIVTDKTIESALVTVTLETNYGDTLKLLHAPGSTEADAKRFDLARSMVSEMEKGREYEFPDVVEHPERIAAPVSGEPKPSEEMKALEPFIGEWTATRDGDDTFKGTVILTWSGDGTSIWRESRIGGNAKDRQANRWFYDATAKCYMDESCNPKAQPPRIPMEWDAATKTVTFTSEVSAVAGKTGLKGTRVFETPDRIRWKTTSTGPDGVAHELAGYYQRVKK